MDWVEVDMKQEGQNMIMSDGYMGVYFTILFTLYMFEILHNKKIKW